MTTENAWKKTLPFIFHQIWVCKWAQIYTIKTNMPATRERERKKDWLKATNVIANDEVGKLSRYVFYAHVKLLFKLFSLQVIYYDTNVSSLFGFIPIENSLKIHTNKTTQKNPSQSCAMFHTRIPRRTKKKQKKTISNSSRWIFNKLHNYSKLKV